MTNKIYMKRLGAKGVKILKICHLIFVMMWVVGVMAMAVISLLKSQSGDELYMLFYVLRVIDNVLVIPGATFTILTAVVYGVFTNWGFFKHRWITVKWIASIFIIIAGTFYFSPLLDNCLEITDVTRNLALNNSYIQRESHITSIGAFVQSSILLFIVVISVLKPWKTKKK